jgi:Uma2 family endonuclease
MIQAELLADPTMLSARWAELAADPNAPDYYELNEYGELILTPRPTNRHQRVAQTVARQLTEQLGMEAVTEVSVLTDKGIRVPDVVWMPEASWAASVDQTPLLKVPDVCVEVLSPSNTREEISMKVAAYLRGGAREVLVVELSGAVSIFGPEGARQTSALGIKLALSPQLF